MKNESFLAFALGTAGGVFIFFFILLCIWFPFLLYIWFPLTMAAITATSIAFFLILMKKAPSDHKF